MDPLSRNNPIGYLRRLFAPIASPGYPSTPDSWIPGLAQVRVCGAYRFIFFNLIAFSSSNNHSQRPRIETNAPPSLQRLGSVTSIAGSIAVLPHVLKRRSEDQTLSLTLPSLLIPLGVHRISLATPTTLSSLPRHYGGIIQAWKPAPHQRPSRQRGRKSY
ncbi:hypothetical protein BU23DRAFT_288110 [Bimuria novae-zelandiae CBS 107.79]|uniref:Uncharacterized protein n=1 Tax=Bimuria novae-zelandiae CBS 107.79 TaxID=1447943 RepID=A0A6A5UQW8_9PLEO|nr:hypothetical protein BU23DRAFT_288110 [Bimuria novae-zelandiae CBS 107.79]